MNTGLVNFYISKPKILIPSDELKAVPGQKVNAFGVLNKNYDSWTYEIVSEEYIEQDTGYFVSLVLYAPGFVQSGVGRNYSDFNRNYKLEAINDALIVAIKNGLVGNSKVVNFDNRVNENINTTSQNETNNVSNNQPTRPTYSKEQIERMSKFKVDYNINTEIELMNFIQRWNPSIKRKGELTPYNIDDFLSWVDGLGGM